MTTHKREDLFSVPELKERGWTDTMIRTYLPEPDDHRKNPMFSSASPMKMYLRERAEAVEGTDAFKDRLKKARERSERSRRAADRQRKELVAEVDAIKITVTPLSAKEALRNAIESYNDRVFYYDRPPATKHSDKLFLERITVNYLRHEQTRYDEHIHSLVGRVGKHEAYGLLKESVLDEIARVFPHLTEECGRQKMRIV